ncbi:MAG: hypothetical protein AAFN77_00415 [Planctomycetota bacterium]
MFETSQPNSEFNSRDEIDKKRSSRPNSRKKQPRIKTLEELSDLMDAKLLKLEEKFKEFQTADSLRGYFQR